jgi:hypothetical protein
MKPQKLKFPIYIIPGIDTNTIRKKKKKKKKANELSTNDMH